MKTPGRRPSLIQFCLAFSLAAALEVSAVDFPAIKLSEPPPVAIPTKSPVERFRDLLAMTPAERETVLANRPKFWKDRVLAKIDQYQQMPADQREVKLQETQLRWLLRQAIQMSDGDRQQLMLRCSASEKSMLQQRLEQWEKQSTETRQEMMEYLTRMESISEKRLENQNVRPDGSSPPEFPKMDSGIEKFMNLPPSQRSQIIFGYQKFFTLSDKERKMVLNKLAEPARQAILVNVQKINQLPVEERERIMVELKKLANMSPEEQSTFLKNSQTWQSIPKGEKEAWLRLVSRKRPEPPMPSELLLPPTPPPLPIASNLRPR